MMNDFNQFQFGRVVEAMENLTKELQKHRHEVELMNQRVEFLESRYTIGKWGVAGLVAAGGFAIFGVKETLQTLWRIIVG